MKQLKSFNQAIAGTTKYLCLQNVRKGYGIGAKYPTATDAWKHTQQHTEGVPAGLDVPLFFEWFGTVDGKYANYGHIAVRLSNGTVWTDGRIYQNTNTLITNYLSGKAKYLGWGESVNDVKIIDAKDDTVKPTEKQVYEWFDKIALQPPSSPEQVKHYMGNDIRVLFEDLLTYEVIPKKPEVEQAFKDLQPWSPINTPPYTDQTGYYSNRSKEALYKDLAYGAKAKYEGESNNLPKGAYLKVNKSDIVEVK